MADTDTQDQATATPTQAPPDPDLITKYLAALNQPPPNIQPDQTPVDTSGFWGGYRHIVGILGEALGGGKDSPGYEALSPAQRQAAGMKALGDFGTSLMAASRYSPGQTIFSNLASGFQGAERSYRGAEQDAAGMLAARQSYAQQQQQDQLARIKEAIPLLTLKQQLAQMAAVRGLPSSLAPGTSVATGGSVGASATVPPEYLPYYQEASARTGIPVDVLIAQGHQESGFDPGAVGKSGEIGLHQILPSTAKSPGFGMTGIDPATLRDPRTNINFAADYLKARGGPRTDFSNPATVDAALKNYNGGGDPNYVANVNRYRPTALASIAGAPRPGQTAPPGQVAPPAPVGQNPNAKVPISPPPVVVAGPGAGTAPDAPPPGPGATPPPPAAPWLPGQVGPGGGGILAPPPAGQAAPDATPPAVAPVPGQPPLISPPPTSGPPAFTYTPSPIPPGILPSGDLTPAEQAIVQNANNAYRSAIAVAVTPEQRAAAEATLQKTLDTQLTTQAGRTKEQNDARVKFVQDDIKKQQDDHAKVLADYYEQQKFQRDQANAAAVAKQKQEYDIALKEKEAQEARTTAAAASENSYVLDERKRFGLERDSARTNIDDLQMLKALSDAAGTSTPLENIHVGDKSGRDYMVQWGLGTQAAQQKWGAQQAFEAAVNKTVTGLRQGMSMGQLSDRDMAFIQHMAPSLLQSPQTRADIMAYLEQAQYRRLNYADAVEQLWDGGKGLSWGQAKREAQKQLPDYVPKVPGEYTGWDAPTRKAWLQSNARPGQLMRGPDGRLSIYQPQATP